MNKTRTTTTTITVHWMEITVMTSALFCIKDFSQEFLNLESCKKGLDHISSKTKEIVVIRMRQQFVWTIAINFLKVLIYSMQ